MATRSFIGMLENGVLRGIYCHWDGYPSNNGRILVNHYTDVNKIKSLIELGSLSGLDENINPITENHSWSNPEKNVCIAYHRDRGEELTIEEFTNLKDLKEYATWIDYIYIYMNEKWYCGYFNCNDLLLAEINKDNVTTLEKDNFVKMNIFAEDK